MTGLVDLIQGLIGSFLYAIFGSIFLNIIDIVDNIFRALAGIGDGYRLSGNPAQGNNAFNTDGGLIYDLLRTTVIKKLIIAIMILAAFLLIIFTLMAFLKNVYAQKQKTSKEIISNSIKGALYFIFVPVCTLLGVYVGNIVLRAIDGATSLGGGQQMSSKLFIACAYNANKFRRDAKAPTADDVADLEDRIEKFGYKKEYTISVGMDCYEFADIVDDVFAQSPHPDYGGIYVDNFYHVYHINHLLLIVGGVFILYVLCSLAFAMARRIFIILIWFAISPACCAMFPLDEGKMVGKYKDEMTKQVLSAYGAVVGINLFLSIMPLIDNLQIGSAWGASGFVNLFILISGLLCVKEIVSMLSSMIGGDDAFAKGSSLMKQTTGAMKKYGGGAAKGISKFTGKVAADVHNKKHKGFLAGLGKGAWSTVKHAGLGLGKAATKGLFGVDIDETKKAFTDSKKAQEDAIGAKKAKKALDEFTDGLKKNGIMIEGALKKWEDYINKGAQGFADFLKEFQLRGGSKEEGVKLLARQAGMSELDINRELAKFEKAKEVTSTVAAQAMPNILNLESQLTAAVESFQRATAAVDSFAADIKSGAVSVATDSGATAADHAAFDAAMTKIEAKDYAGAKVEIDKIDISTLAEGTFRGQVETVQNELAARETAQTEATAAGEQMNGLLEGAASSVESVNAAAANDLRSAASAIKGAASNLATVGDVIKNNMKNVRKTLK